MPKEVLTKADLAWFDYSQYSDDRLKPLGLDGWMRVLTDRLLLKMLHTAGRNAEALVGFGELQQDPLTPLSDGWPELLGLEPTQTPTVFFI